MDLDWFKVYTINSRATTEKVKYRNITKQRENGIIQNMYELKPEKERKIKHLYY